MAFFDAAKMMVEISAWVIKKSFKKSFYMGGGNYYYELLLHMRGRLN